MLVFRVASAMENGDIIAVLLCITNFCDIQISIDLPKNTFFFFGMNILSMTLEAANQALSEQGVSLVASWPKETLSRFPFSLSASGNKYLPEQTRSRCECAVL